ncbi:siderophore-interacting protein [Methylomonas sp. EFPC3]|uniref:siderophore-interacting protein n=1 Tax=Methylomonas sp. EFPC3 TaxID=3021710 RepID=UPI002416258A|nr:siderophore-interacting protein [Methylomonas sp. EFPC3]WFP50549.1 siderophore-interacting protein [Methylomonas sp. EFPC3]
MSDSEHNRHRRLRQLTVRETFSLGRNLRRIRFQATEPQDLADAGPGAHLKLLLPAIAGDTPLSAQSANCDPAFSAENNPIARTYSLRRADPRRRTLDIDFVIHGAGPGSRWASRAEIGHSVGLVGVGGPRLFRPEAEFHLLAGDLSALPAIAAVLEALPDSAVGAALIEIADVADQLSLQHPPGLTPYWLHSHAASGLAAAVGRTQWPAGADVFATVAGENDAVLAIRAHLLRERGLPLSAMYAVPYWRRGRSEEQYHDERHRSLEACR